MNSYLITLGRYEDNYIFEQGGIEWGMMDASAYEVDPRQDIFVCKFTGTRLRVVMRFQAPSWEEARAVFAWKVDYDLRVPKRLLTWEEAKLMLEQERQHVQKEEGPQPRALRLHGEDSSGW